MENSNFLGSGIYCKEVVCELAVSRDFGSKFLHKKSQQVSQKTNTHNFLCQNVSIFPLQILLTIQTDTLWLGDIDTFQSGGNAKVWRRKLKKKNRPHSQRFLNYTNFSCIPFSAKLSRASSFTYYSHTTQTTYYLTNPMLCHYLSPTHLFLTQFIILALTQFYGQI